jgi:hypothetical protein
MEIQIFYQLVLSNGASYKDSSIDAVPVKPNANIIDLRKAVETANSKILPNTTASQLTVYKSRADLSDTDKSPLAVDLQVTGLGQTVSTALFIVVPDTQQGTSV